MKKIITILLSLIMVMSICFTVCACNKNNSETQDEIIVRQMPQKQEFDLSNERWFPLPAHPTSDTIKKLDLDGASNNDCFLASVVQGLVNRDTPCIYITNEGKFELKKSKLSYIWLDEILKIYKGEKDFVVEDVSNVYQLLKEHKDYVKGYILYDERVAGPDSNDNKNFSVRYADIAVLNLTLMMCSAYDAVPLTQSQVDILKNEYNVELPKIDDTLRFMKKNADGSIDKDRSDLQVWMNVYNYAIDNLASKLSDSVLFHVPSLTVANFDMITMSKAFCYNRIAKGATQEILDLESKLIRITKPNTPCFGLFYVGNEGDEHAMVSNLTNNGKSLQAFADVYNASWSNGLPEEKMLKKEPEKIILDENKNYVSISHTEGDNTLYSWNTMYYKMQDENLGKVPWSWAYNPTLSEIVPYIVKYYRETMGANDGVVCPDMGIGYVTHNPPKDTREGYYAWTDEYMKRQGLDCVRKIFKDKKDVLSFAEYMPHLNGMLVGYTDSTTNQINNNNEANFLYKDTVFFYNYEGKSKDWRQITNFANGTPGFYSITMQGWQHGPSDAYEIMQSGDDRFQFVTATQLADLYKQYYAKEFIDITSMNFDAGMTRKEMGNLYYASNHEDLDELNYCRYANGEDFFIYKFDIADEASKAKINLNISGDYQVEISTDLKNWVVMQRATDVNKVDNVCIDASRFLTKSHQLYVRVGDRTSENVNGAILYNVSVNTDLAKDKVVELETSMDNAYIADELSSVQSEDGRTGVFTYYFPIKNNNSIFAVESDDEINVSYSSDNTNFIELNETNCGTTKYFNLRDKKGDAYIKVETTGYVSKVKLMDNCKKSNTFLFSPVNNVFDVNHRISLDNNMINTTMALNSHSIIDKGNAVVYKFNLDKDIKTKELGFRIFGDYKISVSNDNENYTQIAKKTDFDEEQQYIYLNIDNNIRNELYVRIESDKARVILYELQLITDKSPNWIKNRKTYVGENSL